MNCPSCGHATSPGDRFCRSCGHALERTCVSCAHPLGDDDRFCPNCGTDQEAGAPPAAVGVQAEAPPATERRLVTVLFADLVGFTPYSESRDPEEVRDMLTRYFDRCRDIIEQFGGTVDKFIGDAVMGVWGATRARENDAELAVRAALDLVDMVTGLGESVGAPELALRAGVLSGESSVGPGGNAMGMVVGDMVNTASRLQSIADPRSVMVGESTVELTRAAINYEEAGVHEVKGKTEPVAAWRAMGLAAGIGGRERRDLIEPPFTGRDHEFRMLKDQFIAARSERRARLVSLIGEVGIGKTRLAWELKKHADGLVDPTYWHEGRSPSYGDGLTFWALVEMVRMRAGIAENDDAHRARTKLRTAVVEHVPDPEEQRWIEPRLAGLLGLDDLPGDARSEFFAAIRTFFQRLADEAPVVMVFEDVHWSDDGLLDFIEELVDRAGRSSIFVLTLSRPELLERRPGFGSSRRNHLAAHLSPLTDSSMERLVTGVVPDMPAELLGGIVERAAGIPLYAVEFIRMYLAEGGAAEQLPIPDSLRSVIGARIDRLEPAVRSVIQDASVLGLSFYAETLAAIRGDAVDALRSPLDMLVRQEILHLEDDPRSPERGQYVFVQGLIREVAYARLARGERRQRHLAAARQLEIGGDPEVAAAIASHYVAAHEAGSGSDEELVLARRALLDATRRADALHSHRQVMVMADRGLEIPGSWEDDFDLHVLALEAAGAVFDVDAARSHGQAALRLAGDSGDVERRLFASSILGKALNDNYLPGEALDVMTPIYEGLEKLEDRAAVVLVAEYARSFIFSGDFDRIIPVADRALAAAESMGMYDVVANSLATKAAGLGYAGRVLEACALAEGALELADRNDLPSIAGRAANNLAVMLGSEDRRRALEVLERGIVLAERSGDPDSIFRMKNLLVNAYVEAGRLDDAEDLNESVADEEMSDAWIDLFEWNRLAIRCLRADPDVTAEEELEIVDRVVARDAQLEGFLIDLRAPVLYRHGRFEEALDLALQSGGAGISFSWGLEAGVHSAVALEDMDGLERVIDRIEEVPHGSGAMRTLVAYAAAVGAAMRGTHEEASERFAEAIALSRRHLDAWHTAAIRSSFSALLGDHDASARAAGLEALRFIETSGTEQARKLWAAGLPSEALSEQAAG